MHTFIDDFAWIAVALIPLALLFMAAAAIILLDEGLRATVRALHKRGTAPIADPYRPTLPTIWHTLRSKLQEAGSQTSLRLRAGHHKS